MLIRLSQLQLQSKLSCSLTVPNVCRETQDAEGVTNKYFIVGLRPLIMFSISCFHDWLVIHLV